MSRPAGSRDRFEDYVPVAERLEKFYERFPDGRITTAIVEHNLESGFVLMRAEVYRTPDDASPAATGHAFEVRGESYVNKTSYVENAECVPLGSDILTRRGFVSCFDVVIGEDVLAYDGEIGQCVWTPLQRVVFYDEVDTIRISNGHGFDFICTPDHSWAVAAHKWQRRENVLRKAADFKPSDYVTLAAKAPSGNSPITPSEAAIIGWIFTDGCLRRLGKQVRAQIGQTKEPYVEEIRELVGTFAHEYLTPARIRTFPTGRTYATKPGVRWEIGAKFLRPLLEKANIYDAEDLPSLTLRLSSDARAAMLRAMLHAEATSENEFAQKPGSVFEAFQILATLEGFALGKLRQDSAGVVNVQKLKTRRRACASQFIFEPSVRQPVWCPTTKYGTWVMRQKGVPVITGNTSAVGRALAMLGFEVKRGIASREEIQKTARMQTATTTSAAAPSKAQSKSQPAAPEAAPVDFDREILEAAEALGYDATKVRKWINQKFKVADGLESLSPQDKREVLKIFRERASA